MVEANPSSETDNHKQGTLKVNILEAVIVANHDQDVKPCFALIETLTQRHRTQPSGKSDNSSNLCRERTWANEVAELNIKRKNDIDFRVLVVSVNVADGSVDQV